ncbi:hypothetical protein LS684_11995 [Cytobacillus spongiae]|uniref:hypothetical protein n=1 Tax=Cytobacillus spongiae TaxID=2901381 RepID=UPI001F213E91|nr:hypothetical protein [Cytobacillus spongiae]UII54402.1 hypothetical protein LS684_11995 [Cytobacillus spongiae]
MKDKSVPISVENIQSEAELFGLDDETSLLSVNFATTETTYINEHTHEEKPLH